MTVQIVTVPYRYDEYMDGLGRGPVALLEAGLRDRLSAVGVTTGEPRESELPDGQRVQGPIAANIGTLGRHTADLLCEALSNGDPTLVLAGDDTASIGVLSGLQQAYEGKRVGLIWIDAHADFNTPETSFSGILAGMPVAIIAGLAGPIWRESANLKYTLPTDQILIAGLRSTDEKESSLLRSTDVRVVEANSPQRAPQYEIAVKRLLDHVDVVMINIDLDVLDPQYVPSASTPEANGLTPKQLAWMIDLVAGQGKAAVISVTSLNPGAGTRGEKSVNSTLQVLELALANWTLTIEGDGDGK